MLLTPAIAEKYFNESQEDDQVILDQFTDIDPLAAGILARHPGSIILNDLKELSVDAAHELSKHEWSIYLQELEQLSDDAAIELANHAGIGLNLCGLKSVSPVAAKALGKYKGYLCLCGVKELSVEEAFMLSIHEERLELTGLEKVPTAGLIALRSNSFIKLPSKFVGGSV